MSDVYVAGPNVVTAPTWGDSVHTRICTNLPFWWDGVSDVWLCNYPRDSTTRQDFECYGSGWVTTDYIQIDVNKWPYDDLIHLQIPLEYSFMHGLRPGLNHLTMELQTGFWTLKAGLVSDLWISDVSGGDPRPLIVRRIATFQIGTL